MENMTENTNTETNLFCELCKEDIADLEEHYTRIHVGTYSPLTYREMYVIEK